MVKLPVLENDLEELTKMNPDFLKKMKEAGNGATGACASFVQNFERLPISAWALEKTGDWEAKAKERRQTVVVDKLNQICHEVYRLVDTLLKSAKRFEVALTEQKCWEVLGNAEWNLDKAMELAKVPLFGSKPMLREPDFGEREFKGAALLNENRGYLGRAGEKPFELTREYLDLVDGVSEEPARLIPIVDCETDEKSTKDTKRVIVLDCVRTFACDDHRKKLEQFLYGASVEFGDYQQGMAHVSALLLLTMSEDEAIRVVRKFNNEIIPGHWKHESTPFGSNSYVLYHVIEKHMPEINEHFATVRLYPEMYTRKWFCGLAMHALDIELVYRFWKQLLIRGFEYLISFGMAVLTHFKQRLLDTDNIAEMLNIVALFESVGVTHADQVAILDIADSTDFTNDIGTGDDLEALRKELYKKHLEERMESGKQEVEEEEDECQMCDNGVARWVDEDEDGALICDDCKMKYEALGHDIEPW
eukprot:TRINITY_DN3339_c0_g1_i1.p1 TRINITY_DN3339_c0_g1~~TRINITY_DN3339_c0_g1_i1.p1  ORF type:complete len:476 (+),score=103.51 TRINITY_DN3339_c0_g1_i1:60-1487(+)